MKKKVKNTKISKEPTVVLVGADLAEVAKEVAQGLDIEIQVVPTYKEPTQFDLYKTLKDSGYHQGGVGNFIQSPDSNEKVYIPHPSEIYNQVVTSLDGWQTLTDAMVKVWIELHGKKTN